MKIDGFPGLKLTHLDGDGTLLSDPLPDQAALHGLLEPIRDLQSEIDLGYRGGPSTPYSDKE